MLSCILNSTGTSTRSCDQMGRSDLCLCCRFYGGNLIFRGHFNASGSETAIVTTVQSGFAGGYSAWLNGMFLGSSQGTPTISMSTDTWNITSGMLRVRSNNVFVILQGNLFPCYYSSRFLMLYLLQITWGE